MTEDARRERNRTRLQEAHPGFRRLLSMTLVELETDGWRPRIQGCWRSVADQLAAKAAGNSKVSWGFHNATAVNGTPEALAADVLDDEHPMNMTREYFFALARAARGHGLNTGVDWGLPGNIKAALNAHIAQGRPADEWLDADGGPGKIGWDPTHVEVTGITVAKARAGVRPTVDA